MTKFNWVTKACGVFLLWATTAIALSAQTFTTLHKFAGYPTDGSLPLAGLVQGTDGNFYGTTNAGGGNSGGNSCNDIISLGLGCGTVFKITPTGTLTTLYSFCSQANCTDGYNPRAALIQGANGDFYWATFYGGTNAYGTVFRITPTGTFISLYSFCSVSDCADGAYPSAGMIQAANGDFYGTTYSGGGNSDCEVEFGCGTVFSITPSGTLTTLHSFVSTDGSGPEGLIQATNGTFYGTTAIGGANGAGTVFTITASGRLTTLYSFCSQANCTDGSRPGAGLVQGTNGDFYGTTTGGGAHGESGTVFEITPGGTLTTLHSFDGADGYYPDVALVLASNGDLYGTTFYGGPPPRCLGGSCGTVFGITPSGTFATRYTFCSQILCMDGTGPEGLIQATNGTFYGTTQAGGTTDNGDCFGEACGTVFSLAVGLEPFVETQPTSGAVGAAVNILGTNLTDATSVTFNGTPAVFRVVSKTLITTTVPTGATTGTVQVITPNGKGLSNVPFTVLP
jgi:uncharacterized repeat protein (TIGR03803 family)